MVKITGRQFGLGKKQKEFIFLVLLFLFAVINVKAQYTLTDSDVEVKDGIINSCSYSFTQKNIIIPGTLDGQTVKGIGNYIFQYKSIASVVLPPGLETIAISAFNGNALTTVTFPGSLKSIGDNAFSNNSITDLGLGTCTMLASIGSNAFSNNKIVKVDLNNCTLLTIIGSYAFYGNTINELNIGGCKALSSIGSYAFYYNQLKSIDLTACGSLINIGAYAFSSNTLNSFALPKVTYNGVIYSIWKDGNGSSYNAGTDAATNLTTFYLAFIPFTLTDADVVVTNGTIVSCSYKFELKHIIIPGTLDGQTVKGIGSYIFSNQGLISVTLPPALETIATSAFSGNALTSVTFPGSLKSIGDYAFFNNSIADLGLGSCTLLTTISNNAFGNNKIVKVDLNNCTLLTIIGSYAFYGNKINELIIGGCKALTSIGSYAFNYNQLKSVDLTACGSLFNVGTNAFSSNTLNSFALPKINYNGVMYSIWKDGNGNSYTAGTDAATNLTTFYLAYIPYTLTDADVVVTNGVIVSCSYKFEMKYIIIPGTLDGQTVKGIGSYIFSNQGIASITLPPALETIATSAFSSNALTSVTFPGSLKSISDNAFSNNSIADLGMETCAMLTFIGSSAFSNNKIVKVDLNNCTLLTTIGSYAFYSNKINELIISGCKALTSIGNNAFNYNQLKSVDLTACSSLVNIGAYAFLGNVINSFVLPKVNYNGVMYSIWKDGNGNSYTAGTDAATNLTTFYIAYIPYTLTDADVVVTNGVIVSCSYRFEMKYIIIPGMLDGQVVKGIGSYIFSNQGLASIILPSALETISSSAFSSNAITSVTFPGSLKSIGDNAFSSNSITDLGLGSCTILASIGNSAFSSNRLAKVELTGCKSLISVGSNAFSGNMLAGFVLPDPLFSGKVLNYWIDDGGTIISLSGQVTNFNRAYNAKMITFSKNSFIARSLTGSQTLNLNLEFRRLTGTMEVTNVTFDNKKFVLNKVFPFVIPTGDTVFTIPYTLNIAESNLNIANLEIFYKRDGILKTFRDTLMIAAIIDNNTELGIIGKRAIDAYKNSVNINPIAELNNKGIICRLLGYPDLAKPILSAAVGLAINQQYGFTGIKMNQGIVQSDIKNSSEASTIYNDALSDVSDKKDVSAVAPLIIYNQAWELYTKTDYTGSEPLALQVLNHAKANTWLKAKAATLLGAIKFNRNDIKGAVESFQIAYNLDQTGPVGSIAKENLQLITAVDDLRYQEGLLIYPQPANDFVVVECNGYFVRNAVLTIYDLSGKQVWESKAGMSGTGYYQLVDLKNFPPGTYNLILRAGEFSETRKIIKL